MHSEVTHLQQLTAKLKQNLLLCARPKAQRGAPLGAQSGHYGPSVDAVHNVRTGTRRIEGILDALERSLSTSARGDGESGAEDSIHEAIQRWRKLLKRIRRAAGAVRDLDVHRGLLAGFSRAAAHRERNLKLAETDVSEVPEAPDSPGPFNQLHKQADDLDAWLRHTRHKLAHPLMKGAAKWSEKLDERFESLSKAIQTHQSRRRNTSGSARSGLARSGPARSALDAFVQLSHAMPLLAADNLHDFRKGAKKARYLAETGGEDELANAVGKTLKKVQDAIGDWHDWLVLAEEAHKALGEQGLQLVSFLEVKRNAHYVDALKVAKRMRGRLMGEWQITLSRPSAISRRQTSLRRRIRSL